MNEVIDWSPYRSFGTSPTARSVVRVSGALLELAHPPAKSAEARNAARLEQARKKLEAAMDRRGKVSDGGTDGRTVDLRADRAWGALELRLRAWGSLTGELGDDHAKVTRARELVVALYADGTEFLKLPYAEQEVEMDRLLRLIEADSLERDLVALAGREFVDAVKSVQGDYSAMVSSMLARDEQKERVVTLVRDVVRAVENYAGAVIGAVDHEDSADVERVRKLLAPLANHRASVASREGSKEKSEEPSPEPPKG